MDKCNPENAGAKQDGSVGSQWRPGHSGNAKGKPKGCKHKATRFAEALIGGEAEAIIRKVVEGALAGDTACLRLCLERLAPPVKELPLTIDLPPIESAKDAVCALSAVIQSVGMGGLIPSEGTALAGLIESMRRVLETQTLEERVAALELSIGGKHGKS